MTATVYAIALAVVWLAALAWPKADGSFANIYLAGAGKLLIPWIMCLAVGFDLFVGAIHG
jgi:hypothetical protein